MLKCFGDRASRLEAQMISNIEYNKSEPHILLIVTFRKILTAE